MLLWHHPQLQSVSGHHDVVMDEDWQYQTSLAVGGDVVFVSADAAASSSTISLLEHDGASGSSVGNRYPLSNDAVFAARTTASGLRMYFGPCWRRMITKQSLLSSLLVLVYGSAALHSSTLGFLYF